MGLTQISTFQPTSGDISVLCHELTAYLPLPCRPAPSAPLSHRHVGHCHLPTSSSPPQLHHPDFIVPPLRGSSICSLSVALSQGPRSLVRLQLAAKSLREFTRTQVQDLRPMTANAADPGRTWDVLCVGTTLPQLLSTSSCRAPSAWKPPLV